MKKQFTILLCLILALTILFSLPSCNNNKNNEENNTTSYIGSTAPVENIYEDLPNGNYNGYVFNILNNISNYGLTIMDTDVLSSPIEAAVYSRNRYIEHNLGIDIEVTNMEYSAAKETIYNLTVGSNDYVYDICYNESWSQAILSQQGVYIGVNNYEDYINFDKPWWYTQAMQDLTICNNLYFVIGDMQMMWNDSLWCMAFNKTTLNNFNTKNPYELVANGNWTYEELYNMTMQTKRSNDGDDYYGVASHIGFASAILAGGDIKLVNNKGEEGLEVTKADERLINVYNRILQYLFKENGTGQTNYIRTSYSSDSYTSGKFPSLDFQGIFTKGRATFMGGTVGDMRTYLPSSEVDYGLVPMPKYEASQEKYISYVYEGGAVCGIPSTVPNDEALERTAVILEWLSAYSYKDIKSVYYDVILQARTAKDPDTVLMLDIMSGRDDRGKMVVELDNVFRLGTASAIQLRLSDGSSAISSALSSQATATKTKLDNIVSYYLNNQ